MNRQIKRVSAVLLIAAMCLAMLFSAFFIASEAHHDCCGENCIICAQISSCENLLRTLCCAVLAFAAAAAVLCGVKCLVRRLAALLECGSLIALKVELLD